MDSADYQKQKIEAILGLLKSGTLSVQEMQEKISFLIDTELSKGSEAADPALIDACEELLHGLRCDKQTTQSHRDKNLSSVLSRLNNKPIMSRFFSQTLRVAAVTAAVLVLIVVGEQVLSKQWLETTQSQDEQQILIEGRFTDPNLVEKGNADSENILTTLETQDYQEVHTFLGYEVSLPTWLPDGWFIESFFAERFSGTSKLIATYYSDSSEYKLTYEVIKYSSIAHANEVLEQDARGRIQKNINGFSVYFSTNIDNRLAVWLNGLCSSSLNGPLSENDLTRIIQSIKEMQL